MSSANFAIIVILVDVLNAGIKFMSWLQNLLYRCGSSLRKDEQVVCLQHLWPFRLFWHCPDLHLLEFRADAETVVNRMCCPDSFAAASIDFVPFAAVHNRSSCWQPILLAAGQAYVVES